MTTTRLTEITPAVRILCDCTPDYRGDDYRYEWCGAVRNDAHRVVADATDAERRAADALARGDRRRLVLALDALDRDAKRSVDANSHLAAVSADRDDYAAVIAGRQSGARPAGTVKEAAERRHARREGEALEEMLEPRPRWARLRERLLGALAAAGVRLGTATPQCLGAAREAADLLRSWDVLRAYRQYPEHAACRERMAAMGLL